MRKLDFVVYAVWAVIGLAIPGGYERDIAPLFADEPAPCLIVGTFVEATPIGADAISGSHGSGYDMTIKRKGVPVTIRVSDEQWLALGTLKPGELITVERPCRF